MPLGLKAEPGAEADLPGGFGVCSHDLLGWPVFVGPRVVGWERCIVVAAVWWPGAARPDFENNATVMAAYAHVSFMGISFLKVWSS